MSRLARAILLVVILLAPHAGAAGPLLAEENTDALAWFAWYSESGHECSSVDPALGLVSLALSSTLTHEDRGGITDYHVRIDAVAGDPLCPALDITLSAPLAWPPPSGAVASARITTACGATGDLTIYEGTRGATFGILARVPAACGWGMEGGFFLHGGPQELQRGSAIVCPPLVLLACAGADKHSTETTCPGGSREGYVHLDAGTTLVTLGESCLSSQTDRWTYLLILGGLVAVHTKSDACHVRTGIPATETSCPAGVGAPASGWFSLVP